jgi:hypothetical protein
MSRAPTQVDASHPIMRTLSELYLSIFVLFYRITLWRDRMKYIAASIGTSIFTIFPAVAFLISIQLATGYYMDEKVAYWTLAGVGFAAIMASNSYLDRHALEFEKQFRGFSKRKRIGLYLGAVGIMVVTGIVFAIVGTEYREMFPPAGR